jgi:hypothetical protein
MGYERRCFEEVEDDGSDILTIELHTGERDVILKLDAEQCKLMAGDGWANYMDFAVPMYRGEANG